MLPVLRNTGVVAPDMHQHANRLSSLADTLFGEESWMPGPAWVSVPASMWEDDDFLHIEAELPGMSDEDIEITVHNGMLTIRGERKFEEGRRYLYDGRTYGRFARVMKLPEDANPEGVQATLDNGLLRIDMPKRPEAKPKKISVRKA